MMDDPREETRRGEKNIRWVHNFFEVVVVYLDCTHLVMCANNFLDDPTASQSDPSWKEDYMSNMEIDE